MKNLLPLLPLLLLGCPKQPTNVPSLWEKIPHLPSPTAGAYTRSPETPPDKAIEKLVADKRWDGSLSGAAGSLAVELSNPNGPKALTRWAVREALWRAGYPFPIVDAKAWLAQPDGSPPPQLLAWLASVDPTDDLGLVRSRGHHDDVFVALRAHPTLDLAPIPRQVALGGTLRLPPIPGATYSIADANGHLLEGPLDKGASIPMPSQGEWLVQVSIDKPLMTFPVYVGIVPPYLPLIDHTKSVRDDTEALARAAELITNIREVYGSPVPPRDFMLDAGARSLIGDGEHTVDTVLSSIGVSPENAAVWDCKSITVEVCIDRVIWDPRNRLALLDDAARIGLAAEVNAQGVHLVGILSRTD